MRLHEDQMQTFPFLFGGAFIEAHAATADFFAF